MSPYKHLGRIPWVMIPILLAAYGIAYLAGWV